MVLWRLPTDTRTRSLLQGGIHRKHEQLDSPSRQPPGKFTVTWRLPLTTLPPNLYTYRSMPVSKTELKTRIIEALNLQDITPDQIADDAPLFGTGLGLDSIDALELVVMLEKHYGIVIKGIEEGGPAFRSVQALADFIEARKAGTSSTT